MEQNRNQPFFTYIPTNAPHSPYDVSDEWADPYRKKGLDDKTARVYGMIANIDHNVGRLLKKLEDLQLDKNTIVIYMSDNGMIDRHFAAGLRAQKGSTYEGGVRVPFYIRWPERFGAGKGVDRIAAHIDVAPTLLDACGVKPPANVAMDGKSLLPLLAGQNVEWPDRTIYLQTHRGDAPELYRNFTARSQRFKLVSSPGINAPAAARGTFELYDIAADPGEKKNVARQHPEEAAALRKGYEAWFKNVSATRGYDPPRILLGDAHENPVMLTRQDWRGAEGWGPKDRGHWEVEVARGGTYQIGLLFAKLPSAGGESASGTGDAEAAG
ncbi:MAG: sulfatase-like hydrolase/transferase [Bryobacteraceae bacterium]